MLLYDDRGKSQEFTIASVRQGSSRLVFTESAKKTYKKSRGAAVAALESVSYWVAPADDSQPVTRLMRRVDEDDPQVLAENVQELTFTYLDDSDPALVFLPQTTAEMLRIRAVDATFSIESTDVRLDTGETPSVVYRTRVVPRAITWISGAR